ADIKGLRRDLISDLASQSERPSPSERFGKLSEALAEIEGWGQDAKGRRYTGGGVAGAAPFDPQPHEHGQIVRCVLHELILEGRLQIGEAGERRTARLADIRPGIADRNPEIFGDPFGNIHGYIDFTRRRVVAGLEPRDGWKRHFVCDAWVVCRQR